MQAKLFALNAERAGLVSGAVAGVESEDVVAAGESGGGQGNGDEAAGAWDKSTPEFGASGKSQGGAIGRGLVSRLDFREQPHTSGSGWYAEDQRAGTAVAIERRPQGK